MSTPHLISRLEANSGWLRGFPPGLSKVQRGARGSRDFRLTLWRLASAVRCIQPRISQNESKVKRFYNDYELRSYPYYHGE